MIGLGLGKVKGKLMGKDRAEQGSQQTSSFAPLCMSPRVPGGQVRKEGRQSSRAEGQLPTGARMWGSSSIGKSGEDSGDSCTFSRCRRGGNVQVIGHTSTATANVLRPCDVCVAASALPRPLHRPPSQRPVCTSWALGRWQTPYLGAKQIGWLVKSGSCGAVPRHGTHWACTRRYPCLCPCPWRHLLRFPGPCPSLFQE